MDSKDIAILEGNGWVVECKSPLEIRHPETDSFASFYAAQLILEHYKQVVIKSEEDLIKTFGSPQGNLIPLGKWVTLDYLNGTIIHQKDSDV